jgi:hypothetical protein
MPNSQKHENYEILNLIGYGISKFNMDFVKYYGFNTKIALYEYFVRIGIAETIGTVKNRQDRFDGMNPESPRKGWWQDGDRSDYKFRKDYIDSMFGNLSAKEFVDVVKLSIAEKLSGKEPNYALLTKQEKELKASPILKTQFKQMQQTGFEAEHYFICNFTFIDTFTGALLKDARLFGDGYDFQMTTNDHDYLAEVKGLKAVGGSIRMTKNEYEKASEYTSDYALVIISNLSDVPKMISIFNPVHVIKFEKHSLTTEQIFYRTDIGRLQ